MLGLRVRVRHARPLNSQGKRALSKGCLGGGHPLVGIAWMKWVGYIVQKACLHPRNQGHSLPGCNVHDVRLSASHQLRHRNTEQISHGTLIRSPRRCAAFAFPLLNSSPRHAHLIGELLFCQL